ncbi:mitochondrial cytochrome c oxidase subunit VIC [Anopheles darlingi]|uniref:Mitochondrial cytochrome c oxidase subunit VIC n=1 Tax=Anopheles darlingi TaxID=43151 RepID=W5JBC2_ANODA|nr:cytochrome c oxidase subunit 6C-1 [Anopheles darlingi]XP_049548450.1 cytochrome c oxidase subunit 6C-1 [Anopheles darlingi]ETN61296.1 mitochondrial cytochrome c oxidase subunit VIC [Anopheles darlingi]
MSSEVASRIQKPVLRGLHNATIKRNLIVSGVLCTIAVVAMKVLHNDPKVQDYAEFYKTYDANKAFQRMKDAGLLQSVKN